MHYHTGKMDEAIDLVMKWHYSRRPPANVQLVCTGHEDGGLFGDFGPAVAALFYSIPVVQWREPVWELSRLVRNDTYNSLTPLISFSLRAAKCLGADLLISYADNEQNHHGGIYQAASWNYCRESFPRVIGCIIDGKPMHGKTCYNKWGTRSPSKLSERLGREVLPHYDEGKHLYWKALTREGKRRAERLGLVSMPYVKPDLFVERPAEPVQETMAL